MQGKKKGRKWEREILREILQVKQLIAKWCTNCAYSQENIGRRQTISLVNSTKFSSPGHKKSRDRERESRNNAGTVELTLIARLAT